MHYGGGRGCVANSIRNLLDPADPPLGCSAARSKLFFLFRRQLTLAAP